MSSKEAVGMTVFDVDTFDGVRVLSRDKDSVDVGVRDHDGDADNVGLELLLNVVLGVMVFVGV